MDKKLFNAAEDWNPEKFVKVLEDAIADYEKEQPHWRIEVLLSFVESSLRSLRHYIEQKAESEISWESPIVELHYPVEWDWDASPVAEGRNIGRSGIRFGTLTEENTRDKSIAIQTLGKIMVSRLNALALGQLTNDAWFEIKDNFMTPMLPLWLNEELMAIKGKTKRKQLFEQITRPFSIGAATIDCSGMTFEDGEKIPKHVEEQLRSLDQKIDIPAITFSGDIGEHRVEGSLIFQVHPLIANADQKKAYFPITVGLVFKPRFSAGEFVTDTPADWSVSDREMFWTGLFQELKKIQDQFLPKAEQQSSQVIQINALLEIPIGPSSCDRDNRAVNEIIEQLSKSGKIHKFSFETAGADTKATLPAEPPPKKEDKIPSSPMEAVVQLIWPSRFKIPLILLLSVLACLAVLFAALPEKTKLQILKVFGF